MRDLNQAAPHLVVSISGHGFGHLAQTAPVLNRLHQLLPRMRLTVRSALPLTHLRSRIHFPFAHLGSEGDLGMAMSSALDVLAAESRAAFARFHAGWEGRVADEARLLRALGADMVLANVGYLPLAAAQRAGIANAALCSLNWYDIYRHYCGEDEVSAQMFASYAQADAFLRATPGMAMATLPNLVPVAPVADCGENRRDELDLYMGLSREERLVLVSLGGIASRLPLEGWPRIDRVRWLVQKSWKVQHPDAIVLESLPFPFSDLLASCDALLCKPGYGSFVEAACSAVPVVYVSRADWPESPALIAWLQQHGTCREVSRTMLERGEVAAPLHALWETPRREPFMPEGNAEVADWLLRQLSR
ncbi:MAG: hypothetical protein Fur0026_09420 [Sideroxydans sp.]